MNNLSKIFDLLKEDIFQRTIKATIVSGKVPEKDCPLFIEFISLEGTHLLFDIDGNSIRLSTTSVPEEVKNSPQKILFYLFKHSKDQVEIKFLPLAKVQNFRSSFDIGFNDAVIKKFKDLSFDSLSNKLQDDFVFFSNNGQKFLLVESYLGNPDSNFTIHGLCKQGSIEVIDRKWILSNFNNKSFSRKLSNFSTLSLVIYQRIDFVQSSRAKEAFDAIKEDITNGNALLELWKGYSQMEKERSEKLKNILGTLDYEVIKELSGNEVRIKLTNLNSNTRGIIDDQIDIISNSSFEFVPENKDIKIKVIRVRNDFSFDVEVELDLLPDKGQIILSNRGNETVDNRRQSALSTLTKNSNYLNRNLLFAIEGKIDALLEDRKRSEKSLTSRTREFLKNKFNISELTPNQQAAVEMAILTPDIAIIQGPPGTGKSTVVAAICDRLLEIAEKSKSPQTSKCILVSAFQNDTVEHIASKIFTLGLPTIKLGKASKAELNAEDRLIDELLEKIDKKLKYFVDVNENLRLSTVFDKLKVNFEEDKNIQSVISVVDSLKTNLNDELHYDWIAISSHHRHREVSTIDANGIDLIRNLPESIVDYKFDGYFQSKKALSAKVSFTEQEKTMLKNAPVEDPGSEFINFLIELKIKYLNPKNGPSENEINSNIANWLDESSIFLREQEKISCNDKNTFIIANLESMKEELRYNPEYIRDSIKNYSESLAATNQYSGSYEMSNYSNIENVILEEAARSNPLDLIIPMAKATERIIMVGDHRQLPQILEYDLVDKVLESRGDSADENNVRQKLGQSLFEVIFQNLQNAKPLRFITLTEQFRMHPCIGDFINKVYYPDISLKSGSPDQANEKLHNLNLPWAKDKVVIFKDVNFSVGSEQSGKSKCRPAEVKVIFDLLNEISEDPAFKELSVGIISFYSKQVEDLFGEAVNRKYASKIGNGSYEIADSFRKMEGGHEKLRIGSVDSFQGKEFDIVLLSTVRSNEFLGGTPLELGRKKFGFLTLGNRLNVAFSRAKKLLIVVGDGQMFGSELARENVPGLYEFYTNTSLDEKYGNRI
jgi:hypothetical protein